MENWYVLFSKPRKEFQVSEQLELKGVTAYLPLLPERLQALSRRRPLFPRYLFARLDLERVSTDTVRWLPGITGFVSFGSDLATVDDSVIAYIDKRLAQMQQQVRSPFLRGEHVRLRPGHPLAMLDAIFEKPLSDQKRACILVDMLGRLTRCEVEIADLEALKAFV
jgi:transcriptional antiterminator RfaH